MMLAPQLLSGEPNLAMDNVLQQVLGLAPLGPNDSTEQFSDAVAQLIASISGASTEEAKNCIGEALESHHTIEDWIATLAGVSKEKRPKIQEPLDLD
jgi:hypothetical protein